MTARRRFLLGILAAMVAIGIPRILAWRERFYVEVSAVGPPHKLLWRRPVQQGTNVEIRFIHSYERVPVADVYAVDARGKLAVTEARFASFNYDARDMTYRGDTSIENGMMVVRNIDHYQRVSFEEIRVRVAETVPQWLRVGDVEVRLQDLAAPHTLLRVHVAEEK